MDSIEDGGTIRIGIDERSLIDGESEECLKYTVQTYSLKINKKTVFSLRGGSGDYLGDYYLDAIKDIVRIMREKNITKYVLYNGEMIEPPRNKWTSCEPFPKKVEETFRKTLEESLKN